MRHRIPPTALVIAVVSPFALPALAQARARRSAPKPTPVMIGVAGASIWLAPPKPAAAEPSGCPAGIPVQTITVINQADVSAADLELVERAASAQSLQVRAYWGSPCVVFGPAGRRMYLQVISEQQPGGGVSYPIAGEHYGAAPGFEGSYWAGEPYAVVDVGVASEPQVWARAFTHELTEMDVDPNDDFDWSHDGASGLLEVCDPVENLTYQLDGVAVTDFVTPAYFLDSPVGPWDEARSLTGPLSIG